MTLAVQFDEVSKRYRGAGPRYPTLRDDLTLLVRRASAALRGRRLEPEGPLALDHVSFEIEQGEAFAIIGPNGAGKTTSLRLLSRISYPTAGRIRVRGRVGALIDVGAGVHPELTGRENIWLYGRILGMSRQEIVRRFDEIVQFAELEHELERPVKMYSSGMQLRLGFAIASYLHPDVFIVDEALAVGDAGFQAKCVERMMQLVAGGSTLLFVSHNLSAVEAICRRGLFLVEGRIQAIGEIRKVLHAYLDWVDSRHHERLGAEVLAHPSPSLHLNRISFHGRAGDERVTFRTGETMEIHIHVSPPEPIRQPIFSVGISDGRPGNLILCSMLIDGRVPDVIDGPSTVVCRIHRLPLLPRVYQVWCSVRTGHGYGDIFDYQLVGVFRVTEGPARADGPAAVAHLGTDAPIHADYEWHVRS